MIPIRLPLFITWLAVTFFILCGSAAAASDNPPDDGALLGSICPVVYPLDQFPTERGYRYFFFGNAFFINEEGYLVTAAHVLNSFRGGGRPYILVGTSGGSRRLQQAELVAEDLEHDVAVLRATPNPFLGQHNVAFVPLSMEKPSSGKPLIAVSVLPSDVSDSHTSDPPTEIRSQGEVVDYQFHVEGDGADSELLLFDQKVQPGQSGSPLLSADSRDVVGIVVGQWLRPTVIHFGAGARQLAMSPGAAVRIHYALALLRRNGISWHAALHPVVPQSGASQESGFSPPVPISLVATAYPAQALFGGEVVLDALIDTEGRVAELNVAHGAAPFLKPTLDAVHTWTFSPAQMDGQVVRTRIAIVVQFPQSFLPKHTAPEREYAPPSDDLVDHGPLPVYTVEPDYPLKTVVEGSVILYQLVDHQGQVTSTQIFHDVEPLTASTLAASQKWEFTPAKEAGVNTSSAVIVVVTFRHP